MKKILFLIILIGCFIGSVFGSSPILQNNFRALNANGNSPIVNTLLQTNTSTLFNTSAMTFNKSLVESQLSQCSGPPPDPDAAVMTPSCADVSDDPPDDPHGDSQKGALPFVGTADLVAEYYILNPNTDVYEYSEEKPLVNPVSGSLRFHYEYPTWDDEEGNISYKIVVVDRLASGDGVITHGYLEMIYPIFIVPPPGGPY